MRVIETILANGKVTPLPQYHFAAPRVVNKRVVLVGDAAHMGVPRTAVGAHTAVLDGMALLEAFYPIMKGAGADGSDAGGWPSVVDRGLAAYNPGALQRARSLYERSVETSRPVLPAGWSVEASRTPLTRERVAALSVRELRAELAVRRVRVGDAPGAALEKADLVSALVAAAGL